MNSAPRPRLTALLLAGLLLGASACAGQTAVRCGRTYQDRPCSGFQGKLVAPTQAQKKVSANQAIDPACRKRGSVALRYIAARREGMPEDVQLASTTSPADRRLIGQVYRAEGTPEEQRAAVEAACMAERRQIARGAARPGKP
ncbi:MAG: hypothetical protein AB1430_16135 [Pseudomonadota bacterium]